MNLGLLGRHAHLLAAAPGERPHITVGEFVGDDGIAARLIDLGDAIRNFEVENLGALDKALRAR